MSDVDAWIDWSERSEYMFARHHITTTEADEALADPEAVWVEPDYASLSGDSIRVIGYSATRAEVVTVILVWFEGRLYGANGWPANRKDQNMYRGKASEQ